MCKHLHEYLRFSKRCVKNMVCKYGVQGVRKMCAKRAQDVCKMCARCVQDVCKMCSKINVMDHDEH